MFHKVLVANRGEIAVRVMRACEELGIGTVAVYSDADREAGHVRYADEAYRIGPATASESYLDGEAILEVARKAGADAIHPGYGFLAENAGFAERVGNSAVTWVGPPSDAMERLGEKTRARKVMQDADVPVVPGTTDPVEDAETVRELGEEYGYPIAIKAEGGGGGRGMKVVHEPDAVEAAFESAQREGEAYFDNPSVYVERYLDDPRHVEVQILADHHGNVRHLGERDCSLQRRHQKIIEEAPSPALDEDLRAAIGDAARRGVDAADYTNAGTVEFLLSEGEFYFMEVNTRIQVEHTVTEELTGLDIVAWQLRVAADEAIPFSQDEISLEGHAMEFRINAENPAEEFASTPGQLSTYDPPGGVGIRLDDAVRQDDEIAGEYDSMFAKLIVWAGDRDACLARGERAFREFEVDGLHTTIPFHRLMLTDEAFVEGTHTTDYLDERLDTTRLTEAVDRWGPDALAADEDGAVEREFTVEVGDKRFGVTLHDHSPGLAADAGSAPGAPEDTDGADGNVDGSAEVGGQGERVTAEMQGTILSVAVSEGDTVEAGDVLCVLEAMKMENDVVADGGGTVTNVAVEAGDSVDLGDVLVVIE